MINGSGFAMRVAPSVVGLVALAFFTGLLLSGNRAAYNHLLTLWGFVPVPSAFADLDVSTLLAWDCARKTARAVISDSCAMLKGYTYSPFWMSIDWIPLGRPDRVWVGLTLGGAFLCSLYALPPALSVAETAVRIAAALSTMVAFGIERANLDLLIFLLVLGSLALLRRSAAARALGYCIALLAGAIKYYPLVLLGLAARERIRLAISIALLSLLSLAAFYSIYANKIREGVPHIIQGLPFGDMFGAKNLLVGMPLEFRTFRAIPLAPDEIAIMVTALIISTIVWVMVRLGRTCAIRAALCRVDEHRRLILLAGTLLLSGCFFAGQNVAYRRIFLFFVIPGLSALARDRDTGAFAAAARLVLIGIPFLMWSEAIRLWIHLMVTGSYPPPGFHTISSFEQDLDFWAWLAREIGWWFLIAFLLTILICDLVAGSLQNAQRLRPSSRCGL